MCNVFVDDILIASKNDEENHKNVQLVLDTLIKSGALINFEKSKFKKTEIQFLGCILNEEGVKADVSKIVDLRKTNLPHTKKQLQSLIGTFQWFRNFGSTISGLLMPLTDKLKENKTSLSKWSEKTKSNAKKSMMKLKRT